MELDGGSRMQVHAQRPTAVIISEASASPSLVPPLDEESMWQVSFRAGENLNSGPYPVHPGEPDCTYYLRTGLCRFGITCRFNHPPNRKLAVEQMKGVHPERIGQPECQFYLKTGTCKFGPTCKFHHPKDKAGITGRVQLNALGYPLRPNEKECAYYLRTGLCKFMNTCKFHHPQPSNSMLSLHGTPVYPSVHSLTPPGEQPYTGGLANWPLSKASFIASSRWQGPSTYGQVFIPQGLVQVPSWNAFPGKLEPASSPESQQQTSGNGQFAGAPRQSGATIGSSASVHLGSASMGQYALQRGNVFPERPGEPECQFYIKTGDCKFGAVCKFHHPRERIIPAPDCMLNPMGLPLRPGEPLCIFYSRYGICKFGPSCKFDHPIPAPMGVFAYNLSASSPSPDVPIVRRLLGSPSAPPENSPDTVSGNFRRLTLSSNSQKQLNSDEDDAESE